MIFMDKKHYEIVLEVLSQSPVRFFAFGSRVTGKNKPLSDLDLYYKEHFSEKILNNIIADFEESDLPFKVDIVSYQQSSKIFQEVMEQQLEKVPHKLCVS